MYANELRNLTRGAIEAYQLTKQAGTSSAAQNALIKIASDVKPGAVNELATTLHSSATELAGAYPATQPAQAATQAIQAGIKGVQAIRRGAWHLLDALTTPNKSDQLPLAGKSVGEAVQAALQAKTGQFDKALANLLQKPQSP